MGGKLPQLWRSGNRISIVTLKPPRCAFSSPISIQVTMSAPKGPFRLVTVNTAPERAQRLIGRVADNLKDRYTILHVDNCDSMFQSVSVSCLSCRLTRCPEIEDVEPKVKQHMPDVLVSAARVIRGF